MNEKLTRSRRVFRRMRVLLVAGLVLAFACTDPGAPGAGNNGAGNSGSLALVIGKSEAPRTILPEISMEIATYDIAATGPAGAAFEANNLVAGAYSRALESGDWAITVQARNAGGTVIYQGEGTCTITPGRTTVLAITIRPLAGTGTLDVSLDWQDNVLQTPRVESRLIAASGTPAELDFTIDGHTAACTGNSVAAGYHTLVVKLFDEDFLTRGAVEVVRIIKDQTTAGSFVFHDINEQTGAIDINIVQELADPLEVVIAGQVAELNEAYFMMVEASVPDYSDNVTYVWYINGNVMETGDSADPYYIISGLPRGLYRLDVTAFSVDGKRAGSTTWDFRVSDTADYTKVTMLSSKVYHTLALKDDGTVSAWGSNNYGQLGVEAAENRLFPLPVEGLSDITAVSAGGYFSLALHTDGTVWAWGRNYSGQLGDGTTENRHTPAQVSGLTGVTAIAAGNSYSLALKDDGTVWAWGDNYYGQLGNGSTSDRTTPVQVSGLTDMIAIDAGYLHTTASKADGTVWAWGYNGFGQLGDGSTSNKATPVQVSGLTNVIAMAAGYYHSVALKNDGTVWAWGHNNHGQLGNGSATDRTTPVQTSGLTGVTAIGAGQNHSIALLNNGTMRAWGYNNHGQLGIGSTSGQTTPVQVSGLTNVTTIGAGYYHTLALKEEGTVWAWGDNGHGELGDGTTTERLTPVATLGF